MLREFPVIINLIDELGQYAPFVRQSKSHPGCTEDTELGATLTDLHKWLQYQMQEAYQTMREMPPTNETFAEFRSLDIVEHMARNTSYLVNIATDVLALESNPMAALPRRPETWVVRYLKERVTHD